MNILIAEDEPIMLKTLELRLKKDGHTVVAVSDGKQALEQLRVSLPDLVITDIMMPFASGLEIIAEIKKNIARKVPVIILSAMGQENVVVEAFNLGADDYITKPFSPNELSMRVRRFSILAG